MNKRIFWSLVAATALVAGSVWASQAIAQGNGMGPGMMYGAAAATQGRPNTACPRYNGMGRGMMSGYGGYGSGTMAGYGHFGMGRGMMAGYGHFGMGSGMMAGYGHFGMGSGMMGGYGGYGMGSGMMGGYGGYALGLSAEQRSKIAGIWNGSINKAWPIMGQLREQYFQFARLMNVENPDRVAVNKAYARISDLRKQLLDIRLDARQQMMGVLTADQRKELQQGL